MGWFDKMVFKWRIKLILEKLTLSNFRHFKKLEVDFHPELTVLVAKNGQGKTSILDAATIALGTFVGAFDLGKGNHVSNKDARYHRGQNSMENEQMFPVFLEAKLSNLKSSISRSLNSVGGRTTTREASELTDYGKDLMKQVRNLEDVSLPVMAYYGSGRLWNTHKNRSRKAVLSESRTMGYEDCFSSASSFTQVQQWMSKASFAVIQQQQIKNYKDYKLSEQIEGIKKTVDIVLQEEGWSNFHYSFSHEELSMTSEELGVLPVSMLSDGVRAMVSMVADLAWRCAKLNPHKGAKAQQETSGIVFIDEVDMHLHPGWQQRVVGSLQKAFPKVQFILTTHSPQVLSTVDSKSIRLIEHNQDPETEEWISTAKEPVMQSKGSLSSDVMNALQYVDPNPPVKEADWLSRYRVLIETGKHESEEGKELAEKIRKHFGESHQEWKGCQSLIRAQEMKARFEEKKRALKTKKSAE